MPQEGVSVWKLRAIAHCSQQENHAQPPVLRKYASIRCIKSTSPNPRPFLRPSHTRPPVRPCRFRGSPVERERKGQTGNRTCNSLNSVRVRCRYATLPVSGRIINSSKPQSREFFLQTMLSRRMIETACDPCDLSFHKQTPRGSKPPQKRRGYEVRYERR